MISKSYVSQTFQELSQKGTFRWQKTDAGLPKAAFTPNDPTDRTTAFDGELFIENCLAGELERFSTAARAMRKADADPNAGNPGTDRNSKKGQVEVVGERNENWNGAIRSSQGGQFEGSMKLGTSTKANQMTRTFGLAGVEEMKTHVGFHHFPGYHSESMQMLKNSPEEICIQVVTSGPDGPGADSHVYRIGPKGLLMIEDSI